MLRRLNGPNNTKPRNTNYEVHSVIHNIHFLTFKYSNWQYDLLTHSGLWVKRWPSFRLIHNKQAYMTDKDSQIRVTDDVTGRVGNGIAKCQHHSVESCDLWLAVNFRPGTTQEHIAKWGEAKARGRGSNTDSAGVLRSIPPRVVCCLPPRHAACYFQPHYHNSVYRYIKLLSNFWN
jgi:hypothetical protein